MKLHVENLSLNTTEQQLLSMFTEHGPVQSAVLVTDRDTGRPRRFGVVEMGDDSGRAAMAALNGKSVDGRDLTVNEAGPRAACEVKEIHASRTSFPRISHLARMPS